MIFIALAAALVAPPPPVAVVTPAAPSAEPAAAAVDPETLAAARELLISVDFNGQMDRTMHQVTESTFKTLMGAEERSAGFALPDDLKQTVYKVVEHHNEQVLADMKLTALDQTARIYAKYFTANELRELQRLQSNPVLAKAQRLAPQLTNDLLQIGVRAAAARMPELSNEVKAAVRNWFATHKQEVPHRS